MDQAYQDPSVRRWLSITDTASRHAIAEAKRWDPYRDEFAAGACKDGDEVKANFVFSYVVMLLSLMLTGDAPAVEVDPVEGAGDADRHFMPLVQAGIFPTVEDARRAYADTVEAVEMHVYRRAHSAAQTAHALQEGLLTGLGWTKTGWDARGFSRVDSIFRHEVYADPNARVDLREAGWVSHLITKPIEEARQFFEQRGVTVGIEPNFTLAELEGKRGELLKETAPQTSIKDQYRFHEIWDKQRHGCIYIPWSQRKVITATPMPFTLESDDLPFSPLIFNRIGRQLNDAFPALGVIEGLRKATHRFLEFTRKYAERAIGKVFLYDKALGDDFAEAVTDGGELVVRAMEMKGIQDIRQRFVLLSFNDGDTMAAELAQTMKRLMDEIMGMDELMRNADLPKQMTAEEASIRDRNSSSKQVKRQAAVDEWLTNQLVQRSVVDRQLMAPETVEKIAGRAAALLWSVQAADAEDFLAEYNLNIAAGSTAFRARDEKFKKQRQLRADLIETNGIMGAPVFDIVHATMEVARQNSRNPERFLMNPGLSTGAGPGLPAGAAAPGVPQGTPAPLMRAGMAMPMAAPGVPA